MTTLKLALLQAVARGLWGRSPRVGPETRAAKEHALAGSSSRTTPDRHRNSGASILATPLRFFARLFFSDLKLQREGKNLNVKLATKVLEVRQPAPIDKTMAEALSLRAALKTLLDSHAKTRRVMRHLAFFERALAKHGLKAVAEVPVEVLSAAVGQLETLVSNWSNPRLAELRSKMAVALVDRSRDPFYGAPGDKLSNFNTDSRLLVGDASHSMFVELERQYQELLPGLFNADNASSKPELKDGSWGSRI